ncbi:MAG: multicopper oxidase domain-containing protein [Deltaproteobacteria bacterium]|nr:multicopper oxidase domain-containing protein [Deltaproteobacteria bacterium]
MEGIKRRDFLKFGLSGLATSIVVGSSLPWMDNKAYGAVRTQTLNFQITDALKDMATHNALNPGQCYFWIFKEETIAAESPGPVIYTTEGDTIRINITNSLDEPHAFYIPGMFNSGPIAPGQTVHKFFTAGAGGTYLYYDNLNAPVNRVMGLHGAFIVMPKAPAAGHKFTPYSNPTPAVQRLFDDFGTAPWWPGLAWHQGDPTTNTPPFRNHVWVLHQASPNLFAEVGNFTAGQDYPAAQFVNRFLHDPFDPIKPTTNAIPQYFTISGQAGHFAHNTPYICPNHRVGEPTLIRILNAGLWMHSMHLHANHYYVLSMNNVVQKNLLWLDLFNHFPMSVIDWMIPYMRPPDVPNIRGIGRADQGLPTVNGHPAWPPNEELLTFIPGPAPAGVTPFQVLGNETGNDINGNPISLGVQLSPLCYPMHDHSEPSQSSQGGNYNMGLISGVNFTGDRNAPGGVLSFPNQPLINGPGPAPGVYPVAVPPPWFTE